MIKTVLLYVETNWYLFYFFNSYHKNNIKICKLKAGKLSLNSDYIYKSISH